jgi:hypothetical protein
MGREYYNSTMTLLNSEVDFTIFEIRLPAPMLVRRAAIEDPGILLVEKI